MVCKSFIDFILVRFQTNLGQKLISCMSLLFAVLDDRMI